MCLYRYDTISLSPSGWGWIYNELSVNQFCPLKNSMQLDFFNIWNMRSSDFQGIEGTEFFVVNVPIYD